jgi:tetratricopeptide (TPR) repeat protein
VSGSTGSCIAERPLARLVLFLFACWGGFAVTAVAQPQQQTLNAPSGYTAMNQLRQAVNLAERNEPQQSLTIVNHLLERNPHFAAALKLKGMLYEEAGRADEASALYQEALQYAPDDPDLLLKVGIRALVTGDHQKAIRLLAHCVRLAPEDGNAQYYLAQAYFLSGQTGPALSAIRESLRLEPGTPAILQKYGEYLSSAGKYPQALVLLTKAQQVQPALPGIEYDLGFVRYQTMDLSGAEKNLERALQIQPSDLHSLQLLASIQVRLFDSN